MMAKRDQADAPRFVVRSPLDYGDESWDRGQIVTLANARNDKKLIRLGYVRDLTPDDSAHVCSVCGAAFIGIRERTAHGDKRHAARVLAPDEEDARADAEDRMLDAVAPLYTDKAKGAS